MTIEELIAILQKIDPNKRVLVWDAYYDKETEGVRVSRYHGDYEGIMISNHVLGEEVK